MFVAAKLDDCCDVVCAGQVQRDKTHYQWFRILHHLQSRTLLEYKHQTGIPDDEFWAVLLTGQADVFNRCLALLLHALLSRVHMDASSFCDKKGSSQDALPIAHGPSSAEESKAPSTSLSVESRTTTLATETSKETQSGSVPVWVQQVQLVTIRVDAEHYSPRVSVYPPATEQGNRLLDQFKQDSAKFDLSQLPEEWMDRNHVDRNPIIEVLLSNGSSLWIDGTCGQYKVQVRHIAAPLSLAGFKNPLTLPVFCAPPDECFYAVPSSRTTVLSDLGRELETLLEEAFVVRRRQAQGQDISLNRAQIAGMRDLMDRAWTHMGKAFRLNLVPLRCAIEKMAEGGVTIVV